MNFLTGIVNIFRFDKTNWKAVALCLVAATVFWFFNALNKEHTATISYPIEFQYDRVKFIPAQSLPTNVALNITGTGWDLLRKSLGFKISPLQIQLEKPSETHKIPPASVLPIAAIQLAQTKINHVANDTLVVNIEARLSKKVKLVINTKQIRFELGYGIASEFLIKPDSAVVEGPSSFIKSMNDSMVLPFPPGRISQNVKMDLEIDKGNTVTINPPAANVQFEVDELKDYTKEIKVLVLPSPPFKFQIIHDSMKVIIRLPEKLKSYLDKNISMVGVIDLRDLNPGLNKVIPSIKGIPDFSSIISADSVIIRKY